jgi:hypothetical protein
MPDRSPLHDLVDNLPEAALAVGRGDCSVRGDTPSVP